MYRYVDGVYGTIDIPQLVNDLIDTEELQRLDDVMQTAMARYVYRSAKTSRMEHCIGACHIATRVANQLKLDETETKILQAGALLHDLGHPPLSHALEPLLKSITGLSHEELSYEYIMGKRFISESKISKILEQSHSLNKEKIAQLIFKPKKSDDLIGRQVYLKQLISGVIDVDRLDYLRRDAQQCKVPLMIDQDRLIGAMSIQEVDGLLQLCFNKKDIESIVNFLQVRNRMYNVVYKHRKVKVFEAMQFEALKIAFPDLAKQGLQFEIMNDADVISKLLSFGGVPEELMRRMRENRNKAKYKIAFELNSHEAVFNDQLDLVKDLNNYEKINTNKNNFGIDVIKQKIIDLMPQNVESHKVLVDFPAKYEDPSLYVEKVNINILDGDKAMKLFDLKDTRVDEIKSIAVKPDSASYFSVYCVPELIKEVREATIKFLDNFSKGSIY